MKFVLDVLENGTWRIDVRDDANRTTGHLLLSKTGLGWVDPNKAIAGVRELAWQDVKNHLM